MGDADRAQGAHVLEAERRELGRLLFYDPLLSADGETACATCHSEHWGLGDGLPRSIGPFAGTLSGPGRSGERISRRNAPTLWNVAERTALFWDGRVSTLEEQARLPFESDVELALPMSDAVAALSSVPEYRALFAQAFPDERPSLTADTLASALSAFQRGLRSDHAPYDAYVLGDSAALSERSTEGLELFREMSCGECHTPPTFQSDSFAVRLALAEPSDVSAGEVAEPDLGRYEFTKQAADRGAFRVPTLRNLRDSAPYFHDGRVAALRDAVALEVQRQVQDGMRMLTDHEIEALTEFLRKGLLDTARRPDRPARVPSGLPIPRDGFRIPR